MRKQKTLLVASLVLLLVGMSLGGCKGGRDVSTPCPTCPPGIECSPSALEGTVVMLETEVVTLETALVTCQTALATCEAAAEEPPDCDGAISCEEAKASIGEIGTVRGKIVDTHYASDSSGQPTFLNLCYPYEDPRRFTALIWGEDRQEFIDCLGGLPENVLLNREVCVNGLIEPYEDRAEIILRDCDQLTVLQ